MAHLTSWDERLPDMSGRPKDGFAATASPSSVPLCCGTGPRKEAYLRAIGNDDDISRLPQRRWRKVPSTNPVSKYLMILHEKTTLPWR